MIDTIYLEERVARHPRAASILERFPKALQVPVRRYGEVFNRNQQSFRLQKDKPSLILAAKSASHLAPAPYGIGGRHNFYFSHLLNCLYDCRYCFLQGMYRSAHYLLFVNYEDFQEAILEAAAVRPGEDVTFFSGYDGDSLVLDPVTGFIGEFLPFFARHPRLLVELRTKSVAIRPLLEREAVPNAVVAFSFTPQPVSRALERGVPPVGERISAAAKLAERGWPVGLRFDPLVYVPDYRELYGELFRKVFAALPLPSLHSVGFGAFRLPQDYYRRMARLYPEERLFAGPLEEREDVVSYRADLESEILGFCEETLRTHVPDELLFSY